MMSLSASKPIQEVSRVRSTKRFDRRRNLTLKLPYGKERIQKKKLLETARVRENRLPSGVRQVIDLNTARQAKGAGSV